MENFEEVHDNSPAQLEMPIKETELSKKDKYEEVKRIVRETGISIARASRDVGLRETEYYYQRKHDTQKVSSGRPYRPSKDIDALFEKVHLATMVGSSLTAALKKYGLNSAQYYDRKKAKQKKLLKHPAQIVVLEQPIPTPKPGITAPRIINNELCFVIPVTKLQAFLEFVK